MKYALSPKVITPTTVRQLLLTGFCVVALSACGRNEQAPAAESSKATPQAAEHQDENLLKLNEEELKRAGLRVATVQMENMAETLTVTASIRANQYRMARVAPRIEGRLLNVHADLGQKVAAGQALAVLDSIALGEAHAAWVQAKTTQRLAQADFKRAEALVVDEIISQKDFLRVRTEYEKASAETRAAESKLRLLGAAPKADETNSNSIFTVTAPFAGTVIEKKATQGELATPSEALFTIADTSTVWVEANISETMLSKVRQGSQATVTVSAYPDEKFAGRVTYIASVLDKETRTVAARIEVNNRDGRLKPEMFATAMIETHGKGNQALVLPNEAIVLLQGQPAVFVAEKDGFEARIVELGDKLGSRTAIKSGLSAGDKVVVAGAYALKARALKSQIGDAH